MPTPTVPRIDWAVFCASFSRDANGFLSLHRVFGSIPLPRVPAKFEQINLAVGISRPSARTRFLLNVFAPEGITGNQGEIFADAGEDGFTVAMPDFLLPAFGEYRAELRIGVADSPVACVARFYVVPDVPLGPVKRVH